ATTAPCCCCPRTVHSSTCSSSRHVPVSRPLPRLPPGPPPSRPPSQEATDMRLLLLALALVGVLYTLVTSATLVQPGERAVIRRFGRVLDEKPGPGLHVGLPWGMDRVDRIAVGRPYLIKVGATTFGGESQATAAEEDALPVGQLLTGDHNLVNIQATIYY